MGKEPCSSTAILNLADHKQITGGTQKTIWVEFLLWGYTKGVQFVFGDTQMGTILIWGSADGYHSYFGVLRGVQFQFRGTQVTKG